RATRVESFANGLCFSQEPLAPGQIFLVEIEEKELGWCGHLRVGLTALDPQSLEVVPEYSLPDLVNMGDTWVFAITRSHNRVVADVEQVRIPRDTLVGRSRPGRYSHILDDLYKMNVLPATARRSRIGVLYSPQPDGTADMHIIINGEDMGPSARHLPAARPLYAVVDVFASTKSVRVIPVEYGFPSLQTLCRLVIQKHVVHRLAIDGLDLPPPLKSFCKHE
ncbi:PREDICTED: neuralized-like protein 2, partial [Phaethon lepturus]|uniref:neuralized-like protein 2 n=1 Tax=Phaethon lepturus TaxID=97097 RepID=UPI0005306F3C